MKEYRTAAREAQAEFTEKRSRFLGYIKPVSTEEEALAFIQAIKTKHWDATHNVYAYCLREGQTQRYSDDGEPQGTAGLPTLDVLRKAQVTDTVVVVTRYFGGILLGGGGLVRAYSHGASLALETAGVLQMNPCKIGSLHCDYHQYGRVASLIPQHGGTIDDTQFTDKVEIFFHMPGKDWQEFVRELVDSTCGQAEVEEKGEKFFAASVNFLQEK